MWCAHALLWCAYARLWLQIVTTTMRNVLWFGEWRHAPIYACTITLPQEQFMGRSVNWQSLTRNTFQCNEYQTSLTGFKRNFKLSLESRKPCFSQWIMSTVPGATYIFASLCSMRPRIRIVRTVVRKMCNTRHNPTWSMIWNWYIKTWEALLECSHTALIALFGEPPARLSVMAYSSAYKVALLSSTGPQIRIVRATWSMIWKVCNTQQHSLTA